MPFWVVVPLTGLVTVPFALLVGIPALRLRGFYLALATMAFAVAAEEWLFTQSGLTNRNTITPGILRDDLQQPAFLMSLFVAAVVFIGVRNVNRTRVGRAFRAIRDSENTAISMGIDPVRYKLLAFAIGAFLAGAAGAVKATAMSNAKPKRPANRRFVISSSVCRENLLLIDAFSLWEPVPTSLENALEQRPLPHGSR